MSSDGTHVREQILANARLLLRPPTKPSSLPPEHGSQVSLIPPYIGQLDVVVFGSDRFTAAVMAGLTPAVEGESAVTPEGAIRKLLMSTCELLKMYIPKVGSHQRNIHGGGVFDEDLISPEIVEAQKKAT